MIRLPTCTVGIVFLAIIPWIQEFHEVNSQPQDSEIPQTMMGNSPDFILNLEEDACDGPCSSWKDPLPLIRRKREKSPKLDPGYNTRMIQGLGPGYKDHPLDPGFNVNPKERPANSKVRRIYPSDGQDMDIDSGYEPEIDVPTNEQEGGVDQGYEVDTNPKYRSFAALSGSNGKTWSTGFAESKPGSKAKTWSTGFAESKPSRPGSAINLLPVGKVPGRQGGNKWQRPSYPRPEEPAFGKVRNKRTQTWATFPSTIPSKSVKLPPGFERPVPYLPGWPPGWGHRGVKLPPGQFIPGSVKLPTGRSFGDTRPGLKLPPGMFKLPPGMFKLPPGIGQPRRGRYGTGLKLPPGMVKLPPGMFKLPPGMFKLPPGMFKLPPGMFKLPPGMFKLPPGMFKLPPGIGQPRTGRHRQGFKLPPGMVKLPPGMVKLPPGMVKLPPGMVKLPPGMVKLPPGMVKLPPGMVKLPPGMVKLPPGQPRLGGPKLPVGYEQNGDYEY